MIYFIYVCVAWFLWPIFDDLYSNEHAEQKYLWDAALTVRTLLYNHLRHTSGVGVVLFSTDDDILLQRIV